MKMVYFSPVQVLDAPKFYARTPRAQGPCPRLSLTALRASGLMVLGGPGETPVALGAGLWPGGATSKKYCPPGEGSDAGQHGAAEVRGGPPNQSSGAPQMSPDYCLGERGVRCHGLED